MTSYLGTYASAITGDTELSRLLLEFGKTGDNQDEDSEGSSDETVVAPAELAAKLEEDVFTATQREIASAALMQRAEVVAVDVQKRETLKTLKRSTRPQEARVQGSVKLGIYKNYVKANGYIGVCPFFFLSSGVVPNENCLCTKGLLLYVNHFGTTITSDRYQCLVRNASATIWICMLTIWMRIGSKTGHNTTRRRVTTEISLGTWEFMLRSVLARVSCSSSMESCSIRSVSFDRPRSCTIPCLT